jgi:hypothetical protein
LVQNIFAEKAVHNFWRSFYFMYEINWYLCKSCVAKATYSVLVGQQNDQALAAVSKKSI